MAEFKELLVELRQDKKMTQEELAQILFVTSGTISNYETGAHLPDIEKLRQHRTKQEHKGRDGGTIRT